jgi:hypothetical protein
MSIDYTEEIYFLSNIYELIFHYFHIWNNYGNNNTKLSATSSQYSLSLNLIGTPIISVFLKFQDSVQFYRFFFPSRDMENRPVNEQL